MHKVKKIIQYILVGLLIAVTAVIIIIATNLYANDAPILSGDVDYGVEYKKGFQLDVYRPTKAVFEVSPVVMFIHGGAWIGGTKTAVNFNRINGALNTLRENGYTIISPNYTLAGNNRTVFPDCILDIYNAIEWTKQNASQYNLDTNNIGLIGESAGGHIAMMIAFPDTTLQPGKYSKTNFTYLVDIYGPNNLNEIYSGKAVERIDATFKRVSKVFGSEFNIRQYVFGFDPLKDSVRARTMLNDYSPINFVKKRETPVLIIHGKQDQIVPVEQSIILKLKLDELGIRNEMHLLDSVDHTFRGASDEQRDSTQKWVSDFVMGYHRDRSQ